MSIWEYASKQLPSLGWKDEHFEKWADEQSDEFWTNVFIGFRELARFIRQENLRQEMELQDKMAVLNCDICKQWEGHCNEWPHNRMIRLTPPRQKKSDTLH
jgi:hypothetical protein